MADPSGTDTTVVPPDPAAEGRRPAEPPPSREGPEEPADRPGPGEPADRPRPEEPGDPATRARVRLTVRARILAAVLITAAIGMLVAGGMSYLIARDSTYDSIQEALAQENAEVNSVVRLVEQGEGGQSISGPGDVLYLAIKSSVPDPGGAIVGLLDGQVAWVPTSDEPTQKSVESDAELLAMAAQVRPGEPVVVREVTTATHSRIAYISVPIQVDGSPQLGHFVAAVDVDLIFEPVVRTHRTYAIVSAVALVVIGAVGYLVAGRLLAPLRALRKTAQRITETDLTERIPEDQLVSRDEVGDLGRTVNAMLDRLSNSFDHQRRLLDDAGHELRTPITIVRGHLELLDVNDPTDVVETRSMALDELDRMQRLVDDLMVLAKSQRPDFIRREPVVIADLLSSVRDLVTPLGERQWVIDETTDAVVRLDGQRITQALVQLVSNALRFTAPGSVIALGGRSTNGEVRLWVRDEGIGIPAEDHERIFERFGRSRGTRRDDGSDEGAGLGLAIVNAIAEAHQGRVELHSRPGWGSVFVLCLPAGAPGRHHQSQEGHGSHRHR